MYSLQSKAADLQRQIYGNVLSFINHASASKCRVVNSIKRFIALTSLCTLFVRILLYTPVASVLLSDFFSSRFSITYHSDCTEATFMSDKQTSNQKRNKEMSAARGPIKDESGFQVQTPAGVRLIKCLS